MDNKDQQYEAHELRPVVATGQSFKLTVKPGDNNLSGKDFWSIIGVCVLGGLMMIIITAVAVL